MRLFLILAVQFYMVVWSFCSAGAHNLPDTGQIKCYQIVSPYAEIPCSGTTGQDGEYDINPMSYTDNGNGTVTDDNTGLMWQKCTVGQTNFTDCSGGTAATYTWYLASGTPDDIYNPLGATNICGSLNLGGHTGDWRLPTDQELQTIVDYAIPSPGPMIRTAYFPNTIAYDYWSSTSIADNPNSAWYMGFSGGYVHYYHKDSPYHVRCVRGGQPAQSFTDNVNGTVTDYKTGLVWQQDGPTDVKTCKDALSYCEGLNLGGHDDWRLPNAKELKSLVDSSRYNPSINPIYFPNAVASYYWSSTTVAQADYPVYAWYVDFNYGDVFGSIYKYNTYYARCVRGEQAGSLNIVRLMQGVNIGNSFENIQDAYNNAQAGDIIQAKAVALTENQTFVATKAVSLKGGYDSGFNPTSGFTTINGNMTIIGGTVTVQNIIIN